MKRRLLTGILLASACCLQAETGGHVFEFLNLPVSVHSAGLGGTAVSSPEQDLNLAFDNPALLSTEMHGWVTAGYMNYLSDINFGELAYTRRINPRSSWMGAVRYLDYGTLTAADIYGNTAGTLPAKEMAFTGGYAFLLSEHWRAGATANFIYSHYDEYTSLGLGVDLGVFYMNPEKLFWAGLTVKNLGAQLKSYGDTHEALPWDIRLGCTKQLSHAPIRLSLTLWGFNSWAYDRYDTDAGQTVNDDSFFQTLAKHFLIGVDIVPGDHLVFNIGFNPRRRMELSTSQRNLLTGLSAGFAFKVKKMRFGASFAQYHSAGNSLQLTASVALP